MQVNVVLDMNACGISVTTFVCEYLCARMALCDHS